MHDYACEEILSVASRISLFFYISILEYVRLGVLFGKYFGFGLNGAFGSLRWEEWRLIVLDLEGFVLPELKEVMEGRGVTRC